MSLSTVNNVSDLYKNPPIRTSDGFQCPVCRKVYKKESSVVSHMEKEDCFDAKSLFSGTLIESKAYALYKAIVAEKNEKARVSLKTFKKSPMYAPVVRFTAFASVHQVKEYDLYFAWLGSIFKSGSPNKILSEGLKVSRLREYRLVLQKNNWIDTDDYLEKYRDDLIADNNFFIRSIEKGLIHFNHPFVVERLDSDTLDEDQRIRFVELLNNLGL